MKLLGNLYIKEATLETRDFKAQGWLGMFSRIWFNVNLEKNKLYGVTIELDVDDEESIFHELEHYYIVKTLLSVGIRLNNYFKASKGFHNRMTSNYKEGT